MYSVMESPELVSIMGENIKEKTSVLIKVNEICLNPAILRIYVIMYFTATLTKDFLKKMSFFAHFLY